EALKKRAGSRLVRAWELKEDLRAVFRAADGSEAAELLDDWMHMLPPMYFPPFTPMIHNRSRQPAPAGYANVFPPLSAPPPNLSR
ncbi:transposase, partial [Adlercreutzia equolifaciens]